MINNEINERIKILAKELKLPYTIRNLAEEINEANLENKSYDSFLCEILEREYELRKENGRKSRIRLAKFPYKRYIEDLILEDLPEDARNKVNPNYS
ncbi:DNA replication protein DnaC [Acetoanaerobium pronyense]|uniref:DNA replication protein DnaC n=1 Tax=Acetoanaerobium pronyense TaxID=1482736 RepID=A0ABS4KJB1_9FIRM|nr:ATP-binding protein [Acetoanaerobium pronyense]MBP2027848.1 DNA replication protein DnaC [Acetoanaerobium pronyense]